MNDTKRTAMKKIPMPPLTFLEGLKYCHDPRLVGFHFSHVRQTEYLIAELTGVDLELARHALREIGRDAIFLQELLERYIDILGRTPRGSDFMFLTGIDSRFPFRIITEEAGSFYFHGMIQYALIRLLKPATVIETGGTPGNSSAFILRAMDKNQYGELFTIDLPPTDTMGEYEGQGDWLHRGMPSGQESGWAIPDGLRHRHHQRLGDAKDLLPAILKEVNSVEVFIHDSDHSYEHMKWEFSTAWPHIAPGGVLLSDDIDTNTAFEEFAATHSLKSLRAGGMGGVRKPLQAS